MTDPQSPSQNAAPRFLRSLNPAAILLAFFAITFPLWCNAYLSPPDAASYLAVPRSITRDGDIDFRNDYQALQFEWNFYYLTEANHLSNDWPVGSGVAWLPVYAGAELTARAADALGIDGHQFSRNDPPRYHGLPRPQTLGAYEPVFAPTGQSGIYRLFISLAMGVAACGALLLGMQIAREYAGKWACLGAAFAVLLGTPVGFYTYAYGMMSHVNSLAAVALVFWGWHRTRGRREWHHWALLGAAAGVMTMIRPQNATFLAIFAVEAILDRERIDWPAWARGVGVAAAAALLTFSPQLITWGVLYGDPLHLPKIEEMHWFRPEFYNLLFSEYHGLLSWSPVLALVPFGVAILWKRDRVMAVALAVVILLQVYLNAANEIWWAGGSFGARRFVNCGVPFLIAIAAVLGTVRGRIIAPIAVGLVGFNLLLWARERAGELSLDHFVPWNPEFFQGLATMLNPLTFLPAMMGDFAGFGWPLRALVMIAGVALAVAIQRGFPREGWRPVLQRCSIGAGVAWFALAPALFLIAGARTESYTPDDFEVPPSRVNRSLFNGYYEYGYFNLVKNRPGEAREAYLNAAETLPGHPNPWRYLATLELEYFDNPEKALEYAKEALERNPHYRSALELARRAIIRLIEEEPSRRKELVRWYEKKAEAME